MLITTERVAGKTYSKMALLLKNMQTAVRFTTRKFRDDADILRRIMRIEHLSVGILCVDNNTIKAANAAFRGKDYATDILSFRFHDNLIPGELPNFVNADDNNLGDIMLSIQFINAQCKAQRQALSVVLPAVVTHGFCHLLGYDHMTVDEYQQMLTVEERVLREFSKQVGRTCRSINSVIGDH